MLFSNNDGLSPVQFLALYMILYKKKIIIIVNLTSNISIKKLNLLFRPKKDFTQFFYKNIFLREIK